MQFNDDPLSKTPSNFPNTSDFNVSFIASRFSSVFTVSSVSCVAISSFFCM